MTKDANEHKKLFSFIQKNLPDGVSLNVDYEQFGELNGGVRPRLITLINFNVWNIKNENRYLRIRYSSAPYLEQYFEFGNVQQFPDFVQTSETDCISLAVQKAYLLDFFALQQPSNPY